MIYTTKDAGIDIIHSKNDYFKIKRGIDHLLEVYGNATSIHASDLTYDQMLRTENGWVVTPNEAAHCLKDIARTTMFLRGLYKAVSKILQEKNQVKILYAGCGPYATLLTPLTDFFSFDQVKFTLLDINDVSIEASKKLYHVLNLNSYVEKWIKADATKDVKELNPPYDIIVSETMQAGLRKECQVTITKNLIKYLDEEGHFIPEKINLKLSYKDSSESYPLGNVYTLEPKKLAETDKNSSVTLPDKNIEYLLLDTDIKVFDEFKLKHRDSGLTTQLTLDRNPPSGRVIQFEYIEGNDPHLSFQYN